MAIVLSVDELRVELGWHTHQLDQIQETAHEWVLGTWSLSKSHTTWRTGIGYPLVTGAHLSTFDFELDGRRGTAVLFESNDQPPWTMIGWVQSDRAVEAKAWVEFLNVEIARRLRNEPATANPTYDPRDGSAAADIEDQRAMEYLENTRGLKPSKWITARDNPYERVLVEPGSLAARKALLAAWKAADDPRAEMIELQLEYRERWNRGEYSEPRTTELDRKAFLLARDKGREWAGELADLATKFHFHRGLIAEVDLSGEVFLAHGARLFDLAPIQHVNITSPLGDLEKLLASPLFGRLISLSLARHGDAFGDRGAMALAGNRHIAKLRWLVLSRNNITLAGVEALAASPHLVDTAFIGLSYNPADPTPSKHTDELGNAYPVIPLLAIQLAQKYGERPWLRIDNPDDWPPSRDDLAVTE